MLIGHVDKRSPAELLDGPGAAAGGGLIWDLDAGSKRTRDES